MKFLLTIAFLSFLSLPASSLDLSREDPLPASRIEDRTGERICKTTMSREELYAYAKENKFDVYTLKASGSKKVVDYMNSEYEKINAKRPDSAKIELIPEDAEYFYTPLGVNTTGVVLVSGPCVVYGTMTKADSNNIANMLAKAGVTKDEMVPNPIDTNPINYAPKTH